MLKSTYIYMYHYLDFHVCFKILRSLFNRKIQRQPWKIWKSQELTKNRNKFC